MAEGKGGKPVNVEAKEAAKIVALYRDHHLPMTVLIERFQHSHDTIRKVLVAAGLKVAVARGRRRFVGPM
jgi:hypothetical protein